MKKLAFIFILLMGLIVPWACTSQAPTGPLATYNLTATFTNTLIPTATNWAGYTSTPTPGLGTYTATVTSTVTLTLTATSTNTFVYSATPTTTPTPTSTFLPTPGAASTPWSTGDNPPNGLAYDGSATIYVAEGVEGETGGLIQEFNTSGTAIGSMTTYDGTHVFSQPNGVVYSNGNIYVVDEMANAVYEINPSNNGLVAELTSFTSVSGGPTSFLNPEGIAADSSGNIYVADMGNDYLEAFNSSLSTTTLGEIGGLGDGNGQFNNPSALVLDSSSNVYVVDASNQRVEKFTSGAYSSQFSTGASSDIYGITLDSSNNIYLADSGTGEVEEYSSSGTFLTSGLGVTASNVSPDGLVFIGSNLLVSDYTNDQLYLVTP